MSFQSKRTPIPNTRKITKGLKRLLRHPHTHQEKSMNCQKNLEEINEFMDENSQYGIGQLKIKTHRNKRNASRIPSYFDDLFKKTSKNWKSFRKTQYKPA